jgi:hypothetical protein
MVVVVVVVIVMYGHGRNLRDRERFAYVNVTWGIEAEVARFALDHARA